MKIISGGQTGVDRAALDAALDMQLPCGGWCPENRMAEDGPIATKYPLQVLPNAGYKERTLQNILDSDATLIIYFGTLNGGTALTLKHCIDHNKTFLQVDGIKHTIDRASQNITAFINQNNIQILNVAGPRASKTPEAYTYAYTLVSKLIQNFQHSLNKQQSLDLKG